MTETTATAPTTPELEDPLYPVLTVSDLKRFRVAFTRQEHPEEPIKTVDFSHDGRGVLYNTNKDIKIFQINENEPASSNVSVKKHGAGIVKFTKSSGIVHTSVNDDMIRYLEPENRAYTSFHPGHCSEVHSLSMSRTEDKLFVSGSRDCTIRFWDTRQSREVFMKKLDTPPFVALHPTENFIAVAHKKTNADYSVEFYDVRQAKIATVVVEDCGFEWCGMRFSNDGALLMINTFDNLILIVDARTGEHLHNLRGFENPSRQPFTSCFSPDSRFVICGSQDGVVHVWNLKNSMKEFMLKNYATECFRTIEFNPQFMCMATIGERFHLWIEE
jgi:COMPASS component SWD2